MQLTHVKMALIPAGNLLLPFDVFYGVVMKKPMALILQGGGALGAFEYGVVTALVGVPFFAMIIYRSRNK